jgi:hypothetical protein|tara:strand:+ start:59 stop:904 length:846 start_codon:yes stop_codon:yes gene_type:complete
MKLGFIADTGTGCNSQYNVADGFTKLIKDENINLVLLGGDNFYENGCTNKNDNKFKTAFESPYKNIPNDVKFYGCLGNHDIHHPNGHQAQFDYSKYSRENDMKFVLPYHFYDFGKKDLFRVFVIDSNLENMDPHLKSVQSREIGKRIKETSEPWKILMLHTPLISPGEHGCLNGGCDRYVKNIIKKGIDVVCSGHDHLQACAEMKIGNKKVIQVVNGAGAKPYYEGEDHIHSEYINNKRGCNLLHCNTELGYCMFHPTKKSFKIYYFDNNNKELFSHKILK